MQSQGHAFFMTVFVVRSELLHITFSKEHSRAESPDTLQGRQIKPFAITTTSCDLKTTVPTNMNYTQAFFSVMP